MASKMKAPDAKSVVARKRKRIPVFSSLVDLIYGTLPAPFFVYNNEVAPTLMMNLLPGFLLIILSIGLVIGLLYLSYSRLGVDFAIAALIPVGVHWILFLIHALPNKSEKMFDLAGQIAYSCMAVFSFSVAMNRINGPHARQAFSTILTLLWSFRLGSFLFFRFLERRSDFRFVEARRKTGYHFFAWTSQGIWCFVQGLSLLALNLVEKSNDNASGLPLGRIDRLGWIICLLGLLIESVADKQKLAFQRRFPNREKRPFIQEGLWSLSRHPNYCGESLVHLGIFLSCFSSYESTDQVLLGLLGVIFSPVFLMQTSLPWIEHLTDKKYMNDEKYWDYKLSTSAYLLLPRRPKFF